MDNDQEPHIHKYNGEGKKNGRKNGKQIKG